MKKIIRKTLAFLTAAVLAVTAAVVPVSAANETIKLPSNEAMSFVDSMGAGWNLGNAFDAWAAKTPANELSLETSWCGAKTTKELIKTVKNAGFKTIRIPVSWHNHVDKDYNISSEWLSRVKEVVDWCLAEDLYVIINIHHDNDKNDYAYYRPSKAEKNQSVKYIKSIWTQVANTFKSYDDRLVFQGMNEPRLTGSKNYEWWYNKDNVPDEVKEALELINLYNQTFVDTVRGTGGKNASRYLLIVGYAANYGDLGTLSPYFKMPEDSVKNRLIADAHYYGISVRESPKVIDGLYEAYTSKGIPAVITEYGLNENGYKYSDNTDIAVQRMGDFYAYAREHGISVIVWDNNYGGKGISNGHKFIDRKTATVITPEIVSAITKAGAPANVIKAKAAVSKSAVKLTWDKVSGATKYAVYMYKNGKYTCIASKVTANSYTVKKLTAGTKYKFYVRAYVNGKWTKTSQSKVTAATTKK